MWEADIRMTSDGVAIVYHDAKLPSGEAVRDLTLKAIQALLPTCAIMQEVVDLAAALGAGIYTDIKDLDAAVPTLHALVKAGIDPVIIGAFDQSVVALLREHSCPYPISLLVPLGADPHEYAKGADVMHLCWEHADQPQDTLTPDLFQNAFSNGQSVALWHEEDPVCMAAIRNKPVIGICSDRPELVNPFTPPADQRFGIVCHRGANKIAPENTLPAFECALAAGFDFIELDLHITNDNEIVVFHDPTLERTSDGKGPVCDHSLAELRAMDAGAWFDPFFAGTKIPTLIEVLDLLRKYDGRAYLEFKSAPPRPVIELVEKAGLMDQVFFWSFNREYLVELREMRADAQIMARRQDYASIEETLMDFDANIIEFRHSENVHEVAALRDSAVKTMVAYNGNDGSVFDRILAMQPDLFNLDEPFVFARHVRQVHGHA